MTSSPNTASSPETTASLATITAADFEPRRGENFHLSCAAGNLELRLVEVRKAAQARRAGGAFSLTFVSEPGPFLPQGIYPISHDSIGTLELFIVPLGPFERGNGYEAVFN